jgi:hypothetical protein
MDQPSESHYFVLYSAQHKRCGNHIERADFRVATKEDLFAWSDEIALHGSVKALPLHCDTCAEDLQPTHLRIINNTRIISHTVVPEVEIKGFNPENWIVKMKEVL